MKALSGVQETLFIPLCQRAFETQHPDAIVRDDLAVDIIKRVGFDSSRYANMRSQQVSVAIRTELVDKIVGRFLATNADAVIVNLGAGLCTRYFRLARPETLWFEIDFPEVQELRKTLFQETPQHRFLSGSVLEEAWIREVKRAADRRPVLFVAEGLFMYLSQSELSQLIRLMAREFPGAELAFEALGPLMARRTRTNPAVAKTQASFRSELSSASELRDWGLPITVLGQWYHLDQHKPRWGWMRLFAWIPAVRKIAMIGHVRVGDA